MKGEEKDEGREGRRMKGGRDEGVKGEREGTG